MSTVSLNAAARNKTPMREACAKSTNFRENFAVPSKSGTSNFPENFAVPSKSGTSNFPENLPVLEIQNRQISGKIRGIGRNFRKIWDFWHNCIMYWVNSGYNWRVSDRGAHFFDSSSVLCNN